MIGRFKFIASAGPYVSDKNIKQFGDIIELGIFLLDCIGIKQINKTKIVPEASYFTNPPSCVFSCFTVFDMTSIFVCAPGTLSPL